jgi:hypothetical protein
MNKHNISFYYILINKNKIIMYNLYIAEKKEKKEKQEEKERKKLLKYKQKFRSKNKTNYNNLY